MFDVAAISRQVGFDVTLEVFRAIAKTVYPEVTDFRPFMRDACGFSRLGRVKRLVMPETFATDFRLADCDSDETESTDSDPDFF